MSIPEFKLRPYQTEAINALRSALSTHRRVILCAPTGAGKTSIAAFMIQSARARGMRSLFVAHRTELLTQARDRFTQIGIEPGLIKGAKFRPDPYVNIASVQTLRNRTAQLPPPQLIIIDEAHLSAAQSYLTALEAYPDAYVIGLTATPRRLDGKPLGDIYSHIVSTISIPLLTDDGYLVKARYFAAKEKPSLDGVHTLAGDYNTQELFSRFDRPKLYSGVVEAYQKHAGNRSFICFCINIEHSRKTADAFKQAGIEVAHIDGEMNDTVRAIHIERFRMGLIQGLCNVNLLTEGFDVPHVGAIILNRATQSEALYLQMVGRGLRTYSDKSDVIILDHGGNVLDRHGFHDDEREWSLHGKPKKNTKGAMGVKLCPECEAMISVTTRTCPECGHQLPAPPTPEKKAVEAVVEEIIRPILPTHLRKSWGSMTQTELEELARIRRYKPGWVQVQMKLRQNKR